MSVKHCIHCGCPITTLNAEKFCGHPCRAAYMRLQADKTRFKQVPDYEEQLKKWEKPLKIVVQRCFCYTEDIDELEDFKQICRISLWRILSQNKLNECKGKPVSYLMKVFEMAIKEYVREQGRHKCGKLDSDPIFFANPEGITEQREALKKIRFEGFKHLLMYSLGDLSTSEMAKRMGIGTKCLQYHIWSERNALRKILEYE